MRKKLMLLLEMGKPRVLTLMSLLSLAGAALSPDFLSPHFPRTRLGGTPLFLYLGDAFPRLFSPAMWSLAHALGSALVVGLLWLGTALINDVAHGAIDLISNPRRPLPSRRIRPPEVLAWALGLQAAAFVVILAEGTRSALLLALLGAALGNAYSLPPIRLRRSGLAANLIIGGGVTMALAGGMMAQTGATQVGLLTAGALGMLAVAVSMVKDFKDVDGDRGQGIRTLPVLLGVRRAALVNMALVAGAYGLALVLLIQHTGIRQPVIGAFIGLAAANLAVLSGLLGDPGPEYARKAYHRTLIIFMGVTVRKLQPAQVLFAL